MHFINLIKELITIMVMLVAIIKLEVVIQELIIWVIQQAFIIHDFILIILLWISLFIFFVQLKVEEESELLFSFWEPFF